MQSNYADLFSFLPYPEKLWNIVNNPELTAVVWDSTGEYIKIDERLLEEQILAPRRNAVSDPESITFISFKRRLYAYGFTKTDAARGHSEVHHYMHPLFKKNRPELVSRIGRLPTKGRRPRLCCATDKAQCGGDNVAQPSARIGTPLSQKFKFIPVVSHTVLAVPQQFLGGNMHHAPAANNPGVIIPSQPLNQRPPNMPPPPPPPAPFYDQRGYQQNRMNPRFFNPNEMGFPVNTNGAPRPANVAPQNAPVRTSSSVIIMEDEHQGGCLPSQPGPSAYGHGLRSNRE